MIKHIYENLKKFQQKHDCDFKALKFSFQMNLGWEHGERRHNIGNNICDLDNMQGSSPA